ncbi:hypothetical protein INT45_011755 [Circinella minor]|uniref:Uncharacterized protein n=1 Tax=Circinella minor TaxID=1195481 RepID=A0A8H7SDP8_9FUNG|nr:hypothetical protein INT45_011755 [Circinella minor]
MATTTVPSNTTTTNTHHKKHTRHHVKRRSTGRVHVTKLAPMARANAHTDTEADDHDSTHSTHKRPHMRRSQSQRSLNRLSAGMTALAPLHPQTSTIKNNNASTISPPTTPPLQSKEQQQQGKERKQKKKQKHPSSSSSSSSEEEQALGKEVKNKVDDTNNNYPIPSISSPAILRNNNNNKNLISTSVTSSNTSTSKPYVLSQREPAAPVEQTFNAVANNLVAPDKAALPSFHKQATSPSKSPSNTSDSHAGKKRMPPLRSQFIDEHHHHPSSTSSFSSHHNITQHNHHQHHQQDDSQYHSHHGSNNNIKRSGLEKSPRQSNVASAATAQPPGLSRTQQKLMLQRQHCLVDDENNLGHPRNMLRLTRELERVGREYRCVKRYRDPMLESLQRCVMGNKQEPEQQLQQHQHQPHRLQGNSRTRSSSVLPSSSQFQQEFPTDAHIPHLEQRQAIHRRQHQLKMLAVTNENNNHLHTYAYNRNSSPITSSNDQQPNTALDMIRWSAGALLDRVWYGSNNNDGVSSSGSGSH